MSIFHQTKDVDLASTRLKGLNFKDKTIGKLYTNERVIYTVRMR